MLILLSDKKTTLSMGNRHIQKKCKVTFMNGGKNHTYLKIIGQMAIERVGSVFSCPCGKSNSKYASNIQGHCKKCNFQSNTWRNSNLAQHQLLVALDQLMWKSPKEIASTLSRSRSRPLMNLWPIWLVIFICYWVVFQLWHSY